MGRILFGLVAALALAAGAAELPSIVAAEQKETRWVIIDPAKTEGYAWQWSPKDDPGIRPEHYGRFGNPSEVKPTADGKLLVACSCRAFAKIDVATCRAEFYGVVADCNPHSIEVLPDGCVALVSSHGNSLTVMDVKGHEFDPTNQVRVASAYLRYAHGVVWDAARSCLWGIGVDRLVKFAWNGRELRELAHWELKDSGCGTGGHDLVLSDDGTLLFTTHESIGSFDPATARFSVVTNQANVKSVSRAAGATLVSIPREKWWTDTLVVGEREIRCEGARFYKARFYTGRMPAKAAAAGTVTVRPEATREALVNPGMGWVYYHYDNGDWYYGSETAAGDVLDWFPGASVAYFRIPWCELEPEEGRFRWDVIDSYAQAWIAAGRQIAFRLTCSESGFKFATPRWVKDAGAKGAFYKYGGKGPELWEPDFLDPIFLAKFEKFLSAAAARWNGNESVAFIDVGSFGMWGEGHTGLTSRIPPERTAEIARVHARLHKRIFDRTPVLISDDVAGMQNGHPEDSPLMAELREMGVGFRDDSIMVNCRPRQWFHDRWARKAAAAGLPVMVESQHFFVEDPKKGPAKWYTGGLLESTVAYQASYQGIHWWPDELLKLNREEIEAVNLRLGYRFELREAAWPETVEHGAAFSLTSTWVNVGVARPGEPACVAWTLLDDKGVVRWTSVDGKLDLRELEPTLEAGERPRTATSEVRFGWKRDQLGSPSAAVARRHDGRIVVDDGLAHVLPQGTYTLAVSVGRRDGTPRIALPLKGEIGKTRRYRLGTISVRQ